MTSLHERFTRSIALIGEEGFEKLQKARVAVFGIGGVGAACAEALARSGVGTLALIDHDTVSPSNLNRQLIALHSTLGQEKTAVCAQRLKDINPDIRILEYPMFYEEDTQNAIDLNQFDAVADCIDTLSSKLLLAKNAMNTDTYLLCCLGAGNRMDPGRLRFADIYCTSVCPLAKRMRKACREQAIPALRVLFSDEEPIKSVTEAANGRHAPGSMAFVPPVAGMMMAGDIIRHLLKTPPPGQAPR